MFIRSRNSKKVACWGSMSDRESGKTLSQKGNGVELYRPH